MNAETKIKADGNLRIWDAVSKTDPRHTKKVNQRGGFTAISAHYQVMSATRQFGPVGIGWGYSNDHPIIGDGIVIIPVTIWHGERSNSFGPIFGGADLFDSRGKVDSDAAKKAATDGLTKGLSQLGFNADVFLGRFDDNKYVEQVQKEFEDADRDTGERQKVVGIHAIKQRLNKFMRDGDACTEIEAFRAMVKANKDDIKAIRDANHEYWTGDGADSEGFSKWMERRYAELAPKEHSLEYQLLVSTLNECETDAEYQAWLAKNGDVIDSLDGAESREFEALHETKFASLAPVKPAVAPTPMTEGAYGG